MSAAMSDGPWVGLALAGRGSGALNSNWISPAPWLSVAVSCGPVAIKLINGSSRCVSSEMIGSEIAAIPELRKTTAAKLALISL